MPELEIHHHGGHEEEDPIGKSIGVMAAIIAIFLSGVTILSHRSHTAAVVEKTEANNQWSYFQAKSTKQSIAENALDVIKFENKPGSEIIIKKYEEKIARYETEKAEIKAQAESFAKEYDAINVFDDQFDMTDAFLSISMALFGITALTQKKWLFYFSCLVSLSGIIFGLAAFLHISLHSDFISGILG